MGAMPTEANPLARLNQRQRVFAAHYVESGNALAAARKAGYAPSAATGQATKLMRSPNVREAIDYLLYMHTVRNGVTADRIIGELSTIAFHRGEGGPETKDRLAALDKLARMLGLYDDSITLRIDRDTMEQVARESGVSVEVLEAEYRLLNEGPASR